jgi:hypothetical protein
LPLPPFWVTKVIAFMDVFLTQQHPHGERSSPGSRNPVTTGNLHPVWADKVNERLRRDGAGLRTDHRPVARVPTQGAVDAHSRAGLDDPDPQTGRVAERFEAAVLKFALGHPVAYRPVTYLPENTGETPSPPVLLLFFVPVRTSELGSNFGSSGPQKGRAVVIRPPLLRRYR